jgi:hypothetical protein
MGDGEVVRGQLLREGAPRVLRDQWRNPEAIKIAQSDDDRMARIRKITDEMRHLQEQKNEALRMKLRGEVDAKTFREVTAELDAAYDPGS